MDRQQVKERAVKGVASLFARQLAVRVIGFLGMLVLARVLTPEIFGVFAIAQFVVLFFEQISTLGLSAALLRKKEAVTEIELRTVFTVQLVAVSSSIVVLLLIAPSIVSHYGLAPDYAALIRVMAVGLFLASLKTIPGVILERNLRHDRVAASEVCEYLSYQAVAVILASLGFGIWALAAAILVRGMVGVIVLYSMAWWRPGFGFDWNVFKEIGRFGIPIQLSSFFGLVFNATIPVLVGSVLGPVAVGFANFSRSVADAVILQPILIMARVQLPVFSRLQGEREKLGAAIERNLHAGSVLTFLLAALVFSQAAPFIQFIATPKWAPATVLLYVLAPAYLAYAVSQPLMQALKALGDSKTPFYGVLLQSAVQVALFLALVHSLGLVGYAIGAAGGTLAVLLFGQYRIQRRVPVNVLRNVRVPLVCACVAGAAAFVLNQTIGGIGGMALSVSSCILIYLVLIAVLSGDRIGREVAGVMRVLIPKSATAQSVARNMEVMLGRMQWVRR